ncbi:chloride channel protein [Desulfococcus multivorans]|uniref:Putative signal transduction protein with CBS domain containing protein n=3 Tax=Desulfococcus TaxID=896 RepID=S7TGS5_DESML|nr:chloride channel protein [Desulfococcus multivorans]AOY59790.1 chloride channel protein, voltage-gated [Desulfococcus multivorans]AQV01960.1 chloride channel protein [Desulfococcus multivorans]EPR35790.1 putative signal transduction protein with CBS domain containing protein [Desulfococcus multivorans DSM 2059]SJZ33270.1 chloride channel protein, CIC family [Desulfococcus multivorans DSM 2059]
MKRERLSTITLMLFSMVIGVLSAVGAVCFRALIELFGNLFWAPGVTFTHQVVASPWWFRVVFPPSVGLMAGLLIVYVIPEARGPGVPEVILSVTNHQSRIRHRVTFFKTLVTSMLIGGGASVGREGPIIQIGASIGSSMAQVFRLDPAIRRVCLASGVAAGIAATFNAPITGTLFAVEIILLDLELSHISNIVIASVVGSVVSRIFLGEFPTFVAVDFVLYHFWELGVYLALGLAGGFVAILFIRTVGLSEDLFMGTRIFEWLKPAVGGLLLGVSALAFPQILGIGYDTVNAALTASLGLGAAVALLLVKMIATALCVGSGMSGGIFAPSLVLGATLGTAVGLAANQVFPGLDLNPAFYALAGMGAVVAGTTLAPITAIMTIFELTNNEAVILPLMVACISSVLVVRLLFGYSVYEMKLLRKGVNIVRGHDVGVLRHLVVKDFMDDDFETLPENASLPHIVERICESNYPHFVVLAGERLAGFLSLRDVRGVLNDFEMLREIVVAADLMQRKVITVSAADNLETAFYRFETHHVSCLPVTPPDDPDRVVGILRKDVLLNAYRERVLKDRLLSVPL